jgi:NAD(P)-dependent dehydrogenase (short-subunit alcohol dehydrogenase family)
MTFQVNHLAPFLFTHLLLPAVQAAPGARIVTVGSMASRYGTIDFDNLNLVKDWGPMRAYSRSKLGNSLFTIGLAKRLHGSGVTTNCVHPGFVASGLGKQSALARIVWIGLRPFAISPARGAENPLYAAFAPELAGVSGKFLVNQKIAKSNPQCDDPAAVERLWQLSAQMTGIEG